MLSLKSRVLSHFNESSDSSSAVWEALVLGTGILHSGVTSHTLL